VIEDRPDDDDLAWLVDQDEDRDPDPDECCADCGRETVDDRCLCGAPLCPMCFECGGGLCHSGDDDEHMRLVLEFLE
jgi:hypothetical protein